VITCLEGSCGCREDSLRSAFGIVIWLDLAEHLRKSADAFGHFALRFGVRSTQMQRDSTQEKIIK
jgi:hypothetical protein